MVILDPEKDLVRDHFNNDILIVDQNRNIASAEFYCTCSPSLACMVSIAAMPGFRLARCTLFYYTSLWGFDQHKPSKNPLKTQKADDR